jgi:hypothetical protein
MPHWLSALALAAVLACAPASSPAPDATAPFPLAAPDELARRLARFLWSTTPDTALVEELRARPTPEAVSALAGRMLRDPRARAGVGAFFRWWLLLDDLPTLPKQDGVLTPALRESMRREAEALGTFVLLDGDGRLSTLYTAPFTFADERLARHYGVPGVTGPAFVKIPTDTPDRAGILGGAGVLTRFASFWQPTWPPKRSWLVNGAALCLPLSGSPPVGEEIDPARPIRAQLVELTAPGSCMVCHRMLNDPGMAFLKFDTYGRHQPTDPGGPLDTRGTMPEELMADRPAFDGQPALMRLLAGRDEPRRCMAQAWLQFAVARDLPPPRTPPAAVMSSLEEIADAFAASGGDLRMLPAAVARSQAFLGPTLEPWE